MNGVLFSLCVASSSLDQKPIVFSQPHLTGTSLCPRTYYNAQCSSSRRRLTKRRAGACRRLLGFRYNFYCLTAHLNIRPGTTLLIIAVVSLHNSTQLGVSALRLLLRICGSNYFHKGPIMRLIWIYLHRHTPRFRPSLCMSSESARGSNVLV